MRVRACGICGSDAHGYDGDYCGRRQVLAVHAANLLPVRLGDSAAVVATGGAGVNGAIEAVRATE